MVDKPRFGVLSSVESQEFKGVRWSIDDRVCDVAARLRGVAPRLKWALSVEDGSEPSRDIGRVCEVLDSVSGIVLYRAGSEIADASWRLLYAYGPRDEHGGGLMKNVSASTAAGLWPKALKAGVTPEEVLAIKWTGATATSPSTTLIDWSPPYGRLDLMLLAEWGEELANEVFEFVSSSVVFLLGPESVLVASPTFSFGAGIRFRRCYMPEGDRPDGWLGSFGWRVELGAHRSEVARRLGISSDDRVSVETLSDGRLRVASTATLVEVTTRDIRLVGERLRPMLGAWSWWNPDAGELESGADIKFV